MATTQIVKLSSIAATLKCLNAPLSITGADGEKAVLGNCGTIALINQIITELTELRTVIRKAEKEMEQVLQNSLVLTETDPLSTLSYGTRYLDSVNFEGQFTKIHRATKEQSAVLTTYPIQSTTDSSGTADTWEQDDVATRVQNNRELENHRCGTGLNGRWLGVKERATDNSGSILLPTAADGFDPSTDADKYTGKIGIILGNATDVAIAEQGIMNILVDIFGVLDKLNNGKTITAANFTAQLL